MTDEKFVPPTEMSPQLQQILADNPSIARQLHEAKANKEALEQSEQVSYEVFVANGGVFLQFNQDVKWINFEAASAIKFGQMVIRAARQVQKQSGG